MSELATINEANPVVSTPSDLLARAVDRGADIETLERLLNLKERTDAKDAERIANAAFSMALAEMPEIKKVKNVSFSSRGGNNVNYDYAPLDYILTETKPVLARHGFYPRFEQFQQDNQIGVRLIISHTEGHVIKNEMTGLPHDDQRMNAYQRKMAAITFMSRYLYMMSLGLAAGDDNGGEAIAQPLRDDVIKTWVDKLLSTTTPENMAKVKADLRESGKSGNITDAEFEEIKRRWNSGDKND